MEINNSFHRRNTIRERADDFRAEFRSRVGRLWVAQELDIFFEEILRDTVLKRPQSHWVLMELLLARRQDILNYFYILNR